jgi:hypothetical protein
MNMNDRSVGTLKEEAINFIQKKKEVNIDDERPDQFLTTDPFLDSFAVNFKRTTSCRPTALATSWKPRHSHLLVSSVFLPFHSSIPFFHCDSAISISPFPLAKKYNAHW